MVSKIIIFVLPIFLCLQFHLSMVQTNWIRVGYYWYSPFEVPISGINSALFTHIICAFAHVNSTTNQLSVSPVDHQHFSSFIDTVKLKNPSVTTLLSIKFVNFPITVSNASSRESFIDSSINISRRYGFQGLDLDCGIPSTRSDMFNMGVLFQEWKAAIILEATNSNQSQLILTARVRYSPLLSSVSYPIKTIQEHLNWVHVLSGDYAYPPLSNLTGTHATLFHPSDFVNSDYGIRKWIEGGLSANKLVLMLPFFGYAWTLENPMVNSIGAPAKEFALGPLGQLSYREIKKYITQYGPNVHVRYNSTNVVNYWTNGTIWIGFDDVEVVRAKVSYAKKKKLLGYFVWQVSYDKDWVLSRAAAGVDTNNSLVLEDNKHGQIKKRSSVIVFPTIGAVVLLLGIFMLCYCWRRKLKLKVTTEKEKHSTDKVNKAAAAGDFNSNAPNLTVYTFAEIEAATNSFSIKNKLGQGGYGPVYKGILPHGQVIAVKKLSKASTQGFEEFTNEVTLTAKLQHVNLVRLLGFCIDKEEHILIYEYMANKSLCSYLFDPIKRYILDWEKRVHIIKGITQGLLYLQEYSRLTIIHRDLKVSNILLDEDLKPKISDFGMARIFAKDNLEANTSHVVGTYGYVSPEYVQRGIYSTKSDVYSFGILLLQIISGKKISLFYGPSESLRLPNHAYELWKDGKGMEFMDESLDDTYSSYKLIRCLQIALLCVQENPVDRPSMLDVFTMLENGNIEMMIPKKPAFWKQKEQKRSTMQLGGYSGSSSSINDVTVSSVLAR